MVGSATQLDDAWGSINGLTPSETPILSSAPTHNRQPREEPGEKHTDTDSLIQRLNAARVAAMHTGTDHQDLWWQAPPPAMYAALCMGVVVGIFLGFLLAKHVQGSNDALMRDLVHKLCERG